MALNGRGRRVCTQASRYRTYLVSTPIIAYYYTQLIGDARTPPTLLASSSFDGIAVIGVLFTSKLNRGSLMTTHSDADPYIPGGGGAQYYVNQNNLLVSPYPCLDCYLISFQLPFREELRDRCSEVG